MIFPGGKTTHTDGLHSINCTYILLFSTIIYSTGLNADPTSTENNNMGGSIILRAMPNTSADTTANSEAYNELLQKYRRMEYENSQLLFKVTEMNRQLQGQKV